jgi:hypothetical protein
LTAGTRRNGTSKYGPFRAVPPGRPGGLDSQARDGRDVITLVGYGPYGYPPYDDASALDDAGLLGEPSRYRRYRPAEQADDANRMGEAGAEGHQAEPGKDARRYAGRHAGPRGKTATQGKTARKRSRRVVMPAAAVAATIAAGTAAVYGLGSGQPQAADANTSLALHGAAASAPGSSAGNANGTASVPIKTATASIAARPTGKHAKPAPSHTPAAAPSPAPRHAKAAASAPAAPKHAAPPAASSAPATTKPAATALSCNLSYSMLPDNVTAIVSFLLANGYSDNAAAGIAGNIYQESKGDPESEGMGGGGLIGWTPLPSGFVTGNVSADLQTQLSAVLTYNQGWAQYVPALNAAGSPAAAADIYVTDFERAGIPAASTRESSAQNVASACGI